MAGSGSQNRNLYKYRTRVLLLYSCLGEHPGLEKGEVKVLGSGLQSGKICKYRTLSIVIIFLSALKSGKLYKSDTLKLITMAHVRPL